MRQKIQEVYEEDVRPAAFMPVALHCLTERLSVNPGLTDPWNWVEPGSFEAKRDGAGKECGMEGSLITSTARKNLKVDFVRMIRKTGLMIFQATPTKHIQNES